MESTPQQTAEAIEAIRKQFSEEKPKDVKPTEILVATIPGMEDDKPETSVEPAEDDGPELSEGARLTVKIVEAMDIRRQERARLVAEMKSREVEVENQNREAKAHREASIKQLDEEYDRRRAVLESDYTAGLRVRANDLSIRKAIIEKIDVALANFRKQLDAELGKLDPQRKGGA